MERDYVSQIDLEYHTQKLRSSKINLTRDLELVAIDNLIPQLRNKNYRFSVVPKEIMYMHNGIKYYYVEMQCDDVNFLINAHGDEAERLFKAIDSILNNNT